MEPTANTIPAFSLVIERGRSRFPRRPIDGDRFLIGAGSNCQLQLGGHMPFLHSIIVKDEDHLWIDAVVADPPLLINGQKARESELRRGDVIEIGEFVFSVDRQEIAVAAATEAVTEQSVPPTPEELIHILTQKLETLHVASAGKANGAISLLAAIAKQPQTAEIASPAVPATAQTTAVESLNRETHPVEAAIEYSLAQLQLMALQEPDGDASSEIPSEYDENSHRKIA